MQVLNEWAQTRNVPWRPTCPSVTTAPQAGAGKSPRTFEKQLGADLGQAGLCGISAERVAAWTDEAPAALVEKITADLMAHAAGPLKDDMALVVVQREQPPALDDLPEPSAARGPQAGR